MSTTKSGDGTIIAFDRLGDGPPVILVHPAYGHRSFDPAMAELARLLSEQFTVLTYDRRGRGESGDAPAYAVEREVEDIEALIGQAGGSAFVYGMSSGAALALEAANSGLAITKLALYEPPFIGDDSRPPYPTDYVATLRGLVQAGRRDDAVAYAMANVGLPSEMIDQMRTQPMWPAFEAVAHTLIYDATIMGDTQRGQPLRAERVASVRMPTLVIIGSGSPPWLRNSLEALAGRLPDGRLLTLEGDFHAVPPQRLAPALEDFFTAGTPATGSRRERDT